MPISFIIPPTMITSPSTLLKSLFFSLGLAFIPCGQAKNTDTKTDKPIHAFCIDFNWTGNGYASLALPHEHAKADAKEHLNWYKNHNVNTIQTFCVSHNGYAWYDSKIAPKIHGLKSNFLKELVDLGHKEGMRVMGYFSPGTNVRWLKENPSEVYDNNGMFHIVYTKKYLNYLSSVITEAVEETAIDGFMIDALFTAPRESTEKMKWMPCEQKMFVELFNEPFPGVEKMTPDMELEFKRRSVERCWDTIYTSAKKANPNCIVWLTCHDLTHPQLSPDSKIYKQADWLMNENSDPEYIKKVRSLVGAKTKLIQCISGWANHKASDLMKHSASDNMGYYGFAWADTKTTLPYTLESAGDNARYKRNAENIKAMKEFYSSDKK